MVRFDDVGLKYRRAQGKSPVESLDILRSVSFEIPQGGFRWLTGASGAGKTSVLKLMYLAEHPSRG
ncbi:MAG TPA: ATP-binding cassette domain-containing protein, partial [Acidocella sp.]|nr:ATP-binding cassette domain-containing protein [Acidocella sp.]